MEPAQILHEFNVKLRKNTEETRNIMRFSAGLNVDFTMWKSAIMERENNNQVTKLEKKMPIYGVSSEFGRTATEEANRKKIDNNQKYNLDDQPLILSTYQHGKTAEKKFKGTRSGGIADNASYYIFSLGKDGSIDAFPLNKWYNFQPVQRYANLSNVKAEKAFLLDDEQKGKKKNKNAVNRQCDKENNNNSDLDNKTKKNEVFVESGDKKKDEKKSKKESSKGKKIRSDWSCSLDSNKQKILMKIFFKKSKLNIPTKAIDSSASTLKRKYSSPVASLHVKKPKMDYH